MLLCLTSPWQSPGLSKCFLQKIEIFSFGIEKLKNLNDTEDANDLKILKLKANLTCEADLSRGQEHWDLVNFWLFF